MIFGKDDSSSSSDEADEGEDLFGKKDGGGNAMIMMPQGKFTITQTLIILFP
tara:strand:+ start:13 stop:168 length:156 start_codon:yes stop_codon:yes gene_type:complete